MHRRAWSHGPERGVGRRAWLRGGVGSLGALALACRSTQEPDPQTGVCAPPLGLDVAYGAPSARTEALVAALLDTPMDRVFDLCTERLRDHEPEELLGALLVAGVRSIAPDSGDGLHASLSIHAAAHLHRALPGPERLVPIYYAAHALKSRQFADGQLGPRPSVVSRAPEDAQRRFDDAMAAGDREAADAAVLELFASVPVDVGIESLIRWSSREPGHIGHLMIWYGLGIGALDHLGWDLAPDVLRSIVQDATSQTESPLAALHDEHLERLRSVGAPLGPCRVDEELTRELVVALRSRDPAAVSGFVLELVEASAPTRAIWDALVVSGTEDLVRDGMGVALHRFDGINALHHLWRRSADPLTRQLVMVQAAAYACTLDVRPREVDILALEPEPVETVDEIFDAVAIDASRTAARVLGYLAFGGEIDAVKARAEQLTILMAHRVDEHSYKFPVAVIEETALASAAWQPLALAAIGGQYGRSPSTVGSPWDHYDEVMAQIDAG